IDCGTVMIPSECDPKSS
uniref:RK peptide n=1 Tax=Buthus occitanus tunetanus TaxID=6871 RepID=DIRK_BUTOC|nr:RecName: Full=RK peptide; AltName: Full=Disintegrin-like peptide [Buthus occitanus tunetanus]